MTPMEKIPYVRELEGTSDSITATYILGDVVKSGQWLFLEHSAEENLTTNFTSLRIGQGRDPSDVHWWEEHLNCVAGQLYWMDKPLLFIPEGHRFICLFVGTTLGDHLRVYLDGYLTPKVESRKVFK